MLGKKRKKMSFSDLERGLGETKPSGKGGFFQGENSPKDTASHGGFWQKLKYFFSSENKEVAQHLIVIFGVLVLILLSCAVINKVEQGANPIGQQASGENVWGEDLRQTVAEEEDSSQTESGDTPVKPAEGEVLNNDNDYFINYEMEREKVRSEQLELLNEMVEGENTLPEVKQEAENKILAITEGMENELLLESLLVAKYGGEAVVFVQEDKVNVILRPQEGGIDDQEAEKIAQLVDTYTGIGYENAIIVIKD